MKKSLTIISLIFLTSALYAQKTDYKDGIIHTEDGKELAKVVRIKDKENLGLTSTYELYSMSGEKLIIATVATDFAAERDDNSGYFYRFSFLTADEVGIFSLAKLGTEKAFAKLIGSGNFIIDGKVDTKKLDEFIATKSKNPKTVVEYNLVERNRMFFVNLKNGDIFQGKDIVVGRYKDITNSSNFDTYQFSLPDGLIVAEASFSGGNNAKNCRITTKKDNMTRMVSIATEGKVKMLMNSDDRNFITIEKIAKWLVKNLYL